MYDAIVIGARVAGSPTAMLLARQGHRVLLIDRAQFPSDTVSTHFLHPGGSSYLNRWGLLDEVLETTPSWDRFTLTREGISVTGAPPLDAVQRRLGALHGDDGSYAVTTWCGPRRTFLDKVLLDAAAEAGAEVRQETTVDELSWDGDQVVGVKGHTRSGAAFSETARIIIGADGKHSPTAAAVGVDAYNERSRCTFAYYTYWSGLSLEGIRWPLHVRGRFAAVIFPTNDGLHAVLVWGPDEWFSDFRADVEGNYWKILEFVAPEVAQLVRDQGQREERFYGTVDQPNFFRKPYGPGWALVGDAGYNKDQCTAIGMTHAFRDTELLCSSLRQWFAGERSFDEALGSYHRGRDEDSMAYYDFVCMLAEMNPPRMEELQLLAAMKHNETAFGRFLGVFGDMVPVPEFFAPENLGQIMQSASAPTLGEPIFDDFEAKVKEYAVNPFRRSE